MNVGWVHLLGKTSGFGWVEKKTIAIKKIKNYSLFVMKIKSYPLKVVLHKSTDQKGFEFNFRKLWGFNMPIAYIFATRRCITFQPMQSIRSNSLSLKVLKAHTISRLQRYSPRFVLSNVCPSPMFVLVRNLFGFDFCTVQRLY